MDVVILLMNIVTNFTLDESEEVDFKHIPSCATILSSGEIAISVPKEKKLYLVDSENLTKLAHVNIKKQAQGYTRFDQRRYRCGMG